MTEPQTKLLRWLRLALGAVALTLLATLVLAKKPWEVNIEKLIDEGGKVPLEAFIADGLWWATLVCLGVVLALISTMRWWLVPMPQLETKQPVSKENDYDRDRLLCRRQKDRRSLVTVALLGICLLALIERLPRMGLSLWNDEEYTLRRYVFGYQKPQTDGSFKVDRVTWQETFFYNRGANNHIPFSIAGRLSLEAWRNLSRGDAHFFSEAALRLPSLIAGVAGIFFIGLLVAKTVSPVAALSAAALLALHPWHLRYSTEARGYSFMLLFAVLAMWFAILAFQRGRWRDWFGYAICQFLYLWSFPGAIYLVASCNTILLGGILMQRPLWRRGLAQTRRWLVASAIVACVFLLAISPSIRQIKLYLGRDIAQGNMDADWWLDIGSHLLAGIRYAMDDPANLQYLSLQHLPLIKGNNSTLTIFCLVGLISLFGLCKALRLGLPATVLTSSPLVAGLLAFLHTRLSGNFLFSWYLLYVLPALAVLFFLGIEVIACLVAGSQFRRIITSTALSLIVVISYGFWTSQTRQIMKTIPRQPLREAIQAARVAAPNPLIATTGVSSRQFSSYCPELQPIDEASESDNLELIEEMLSKADAQRRPLIVIFSGGKLRKIQDATLYARLAKSDDFNFTKTVTGHEDFFEVELFMHNPNPPSSDTFQTQ